MFSKAVSYVGVRRSTLLATLDKKKQGTIKYTVQGNVLRVHSNY